MVSVYEVSLFTCKPLGFALKTIVNHLDGFHLGLSTTATIEMLDHCLLSCLQYDNCYHQQVKGIPMGSPISELIAEAILQKLGRMFIFFLGSYQNSDRGTSTTPSSLLRKTGFPLITLNWRVGNKVVQFVKKMKTSISFYPTDLPIENQVPILVDWCFWLNCDV